MKIRAYEESDLEALRAIHGRQGFGYAFPDLGNPLFLTKLVLGREEGGKGIAGAALLRLTAEAYLLLDPDAGSPRGKWQSLLALHEATRRACSRFGRCACLAAAGDRKEIREAADAIGLGSG
jgi:hypothetical protein